MYQIDHCKRLAQMAVVALLTCSAVARADNCAGGADATGNECSGDQAVRVFSGAESQLVYLEGQVALAELRAARAKQKLIDAAAAMKAAEADVMSAEAELKTAHIALNLGEQKQRGPLATKAR